MEGRKSSGRFSWRQGMNKKKWIWLLAAILCVGLILWLVFSSAPADQQEAEQENEATAAPVEATQAPSVAASVTETPLPSVEPSPTEEPVEEFTGLDVEDEVIIELDEDEGVGGL